MEARQVLYGFRVVGLGRYMEACQVLHVADGTSHTHTQHTHTYLSLFSLSLFLPAPPPARVLSPLSLSLSLSLLPSLAPSSPLPPLTPQGKGRRHMEARQEGEEEGRVALVALLWEAPEASLWEVPVALLWEAPLHMVGHPQGKGGRGGRRLEDH
jgi:hypothetical protein